MVQSMLGAMRAETSRAQFQSPVVPVEPQITDKHQIVDKSDLVPFEERVWDLSDLLPEMREWKELPEAGKWPTSAAFKADYPRLKERLDALVQQRHAETLAYSQEAAEALRRGNWFEVQAAADKITQNMSDCSRLVFFISLLNASYQGTAEARELSVTTEPAASMVYSTAGGEMLRQLVHVVHEIPEREALVTIKQGSHPIWEHLQKAIAEKDYYLKGDYDRAIEEARDATEKDARASTAIRRVERHYDRRDIPERSKRMLTAYLCKVLQERVREPGKADDVAGRWSQKAGMEESWLDNMTDTILRDFPAFEQQFDEMLNQQDDLTRLYREWDTIHMPEAERYQSHTAVEIIHAMCAQLGGEFPGLFQRAQDENWIHGAPDPAKSSQQFAMPNMPEKYLAGSHPYIHMQYEPTPGKFMTIWHELAHGFGFALGIKRAESLGEQSASLMVHELFAAIFEELLFAYMEENAPDSLEKVRFGQDHTYKQIYNILGLSKMTAFERSLYRTIDSGSAEEGFKPLTWQEAGESFNALYPKPERRQDYPKDYWLKATPVSDITERGSYHLAHYPVAKLAAIQTIEQIRNGTLSWNQLGVILADAMGQGRNLSLKDFHAMLGVRLDEASVGQTVQLLQQRLKRMEAHMAAYPREELETKTLRHNANFMANTVLDLSKEQGAEYVEALWRVIHQRGSEEDYAIFRTAQPEEVILTSHITESGLTDKPLRTLSGALFAEKKEVLGHYLPHVLQAIQTIHEDNENPHRVWQDKHNEPWPTLDVAAYFFVEHLQPKLANPEAQKFTTMTRADWEAALVRFAEQNPHQQDLIAKYSKALKVMSENGLQEDRMVRLTYMERHLPKAEQGTLDYLPLIQTYMMDKLNLTPERVVETLQQRTLQLLMNGLSLEAEGQGADATTAPATNIITLTETETQRVLAEINAQRANG